MNGFLQFNNNNLSKEYVAFQIGKNEHLINENKELYYTEREHIFYNRDNEIRNNSEVINNKAMQYLNDIHNYFIKHNTDYKIIISPLYDQVKFNSNDLSKLYHIFGDENIYDFSGINSITSNKYNYYETSHYRETVGDSIIKQIYFE